MKTMMIVTMTASLATLALLLFAGGKAQAVSEDAQKKLADFTSNPVSALWSLVSPAKKGA